MLCVFWSSKILIDLGQGKEWWNGCYVPERKLVCQISYIFAKPIVTKHVCMALEKCM